MCLGACGVLSRDDGQHGGGGAAAGGGRAPTAPTTGPDAFERSGRATGFQLTLPPAGTATPYPLVVALHSLFHDGGEPKNEWGFDELARTRGFAVVYPNGIEDSWNAGNCCEAAARAGVDDVAWLRSLVAHLEENHPVDRRRVYLVGFSNGGMLAFRYACEHGDELAGLGVVSGSLQTDSCAPPAAVNVVAVHGLLDRHVPNDGTARSAPLRIPITSGTDSLAPFRKIAACPVPREFGEKIFTGPDGGVPAEGAERARPAVGAVAPVNGHGGDGLRDGAAAVRPPPAGRSPGPPTAAPTVAVRQETTCGADARVVEFLLPTLGHRWPPASGPGAFDTARIIWEILGPGRSRVPGPRM
jgi:poly(3-hydroxybutyrate) depolymerase